MQLLIKNLKYIILKIYNAMEQKKKLTHDKNTFILKLLLQIKYINN